MKRRAALLGALLSGCVPEAHPAPNDGVPGGPSCAMGQIELITGDDGVTRPVFVRATDRAILYAVHERGTACGDIDLGATEREEQGTFVADESFVPTPCGPGGHLPETAFGATNGNWSQRYLHERRCGDRDDTPLEARWGDPGTCGNWEVCGESLQAERTWVWVRPARSCAEFLGLGRVCDPMPTVEVHCNREIDPDGAGGEPPVVARCWQKDLNLWTQVLGYQFVPEGGAPLSDTACTIEGELPATREDVPARGGTLAEGLELAKRCRGYAPASRLAPLAPGATYRFRCRHEGATKEPGTQADLLAARVDVETGSVHRHHYLSGLESPAPTIASFYALGSTHLVQKPGLWGSSPCNGGLLCASGQWGREDIAIDPDDRLAHDTMVILHPEVLRGGAENVGTHRWNVFGPSEEWWCEAPSVASEFWGKIYSTYWEVWVR